MEHNLSCCLSKALIFTLLPLTLLQGIVPNNDTSLILTAHSISLEQGLTCLSTLDFDYFRYSALNLYSALRIYSLAVPFPFKEPLGWRLQVKACLNEDITTIFPDN